MEQFEQVIRFDSDEAIQRKRKAFSYKIGTETEDFTTVLDTNKSFLAEPFAIAVRD